MKMHFFPSPSPPSFYPLYHHVLFVRSIETGMEKKCHCLIKYLSGIEDPIHRVSLEPSRLYGCGWRLFGREF